MKQTKILLGMIAAFVIAIMSAVPSQARVNAPANTGASVVAFGEMLNDMADALGAAENPQDADAVLSPIIIKYGTKIDGTTVLTPADKTYISDCMANVMRQTTLRALELGGVDPADPEIANYVDSTLQTANAQIAEKVKAANTIAEAMEVMGGIFQ